MLQAGADVNTAADSGKTALHHAARRSDPECMSLIIQTEADVHAVENEGKNAWYWIYDWDAGTVA